MARIWDSYLTALDKAHLAASRDRRVGFGSKPALLLIDLYRAVFGDKPEPLLESIKTWPSSHGMAGWNALPHIQRVLEASRAAPSPATEPRPRPTTGTSARLAVMRQKPRVVPMPPGSALSALSRNTPPVRVVTPV